MKPTQSIFNDRNIQPFWVSIDKSMFDMVDNIRNSDYNTSKAKGGSVTSSAQLTWLWAYKDVLATLGIQVDFSPNPVTGGMIGTLWKDNEVYVD